MAETTIKTRVLQKHASEAEWANAADFIPKNGEFIVYDTDSTHNY